ncbi:MAG: metallophosphoesterase [Bacteroidetes bacterium]|nr:metallophosphoesterase [Bacteroidota bacterium]
MQSIDQKKQELLEKRHFDIGAAKSGVQRDHRYGDTIITSQIFENATIYVHPVKGPFEVHGSILKKYTELGAYGPHPKTGKKELGLPISDEGKSVEGYATASFFDYGAIFADYGACSTGPIPIYGKLYEYWVSTYKDINAYIGYPLCEPFDLPNGEKGIFFENAFLFTIDGQSDVVQFNYHGPLLGDPKITSSKSLLIENAYTSEIAVGKWQKVETNLNAVLEAASKFLILEIVKSGGTIPAKLELNKVAGQASLLVKEVTLNITAGKMPDILLFNLAVFNNNPKPGIIGLHAIYTRDTWKDFGVVHVSDLHISPLNDYYYSTLKNSKFSDTADQYFENFNDNFRDFIRYVNKLHDNGEIDLILITGDLIDFQYCSTDEIRNFPLGGFVFLENLIKGKLPSPKPGVISEELKVPIVTTLGNHDYRTLAYLLDCNVVLDVDESVKQVVSETVGVVPFVGGPAASTVNFVVSEIGAGLDWVLGGSSINITEIEQYSVFNLLKEETTVLYKDEKGKIIPTPRVDSRISILSLVTRTPYYYNTRISNKAASLTEVRLGNNVIVNLNTGHDKAAPDSNSSWEQLKVAYDNYFKTGSENRQNLLIGGSPDVEGITQNHINTLKNVLNDPNNTGAIIVTMHAPPINTKGNEYGPFLRETDYNLWKKENILFYLQKTHTDIVDIIAGNKNFDKFEELAKVKYPTWIEAIGQPYFKTGTIEDDLDFGISDGLTDQLLNLCAGIEVNRPVDLVLSGHGHRNVEYRLGRSGNTLLYYMDFYTENPTTGYNTRLYNANNGDSVVKVQINANLIPEYIPDPITAHKTVGGKIIQFYQILTRPYNDPLNSSKDRKEWWNKHRPLITQTAALGPIESCQRDDVNKPDSFSETVFQGFRVIRVRKNVIDKIHYVILKELRSLNYEMPWENEYKTPNASASSYNGSSTNTTVISR